VNPTVLGAIIVFFIGTCLGSFLSVVISRIQLGKKGIISGRSECPNCRHQLTARNLVPLFSWLFQKGLCQYCSKPISPIYPALEFSSGLLFLVSYFSINYPLFEINTHFQGFTAISPAALAWLKLFYLPREFLIYFCLSGLSSPSPR
jgi:leader peptidase (prepilin peptidase)/N-methyltransferase